MTKTQIIAQIAATTGIKASLTPRCNETIENIKWYEVPVLETDEAKSLGWKRNIYFYTIDEGLAGEAAYYYKDAPRQELPVDNAVIDAIKTYVFSQANVINYNLISYNEVKNGTDTNRIALAEVYSTVNTTDANKKTWVLYNKNAGAIAHRILV
jgi:hypothetical protein